MKHECAFYYFSLIYFVFDKCSQFGIDYQWNEILKYKLNSASSRNLWKLELFLMAGRKPLYFLFIEGVPDLNHQTIDQFP